MEEAGRPQQAALVSSAEQPEGSWRKACAHCKSFSNHHHLCRMQETLLFLAAKSHLVPHKPWEETPRHGNVSKEQFEREDQSCKDFLSPRIKERRQQREAWLAGGLAWFTWRAKSGGTGMMGRHSQGPFHPQQSSGSL